MNLNTSKYLRLVAGWSTMKAAMEDDESTDILDEEAVGVALAAAQAIADEGGSLELQIRAAIAAYVEDVEDDTEGAAKKKKAPAKTMPPGFMPYK